MMDVTVHAPTDAEREAVSRALAEDLGADGDVSAALIPDREARAVILAREEGVLAGTGCVQEAFRQVDPSVRVDWLVRDAARVQPDQKVATIGGRLTSLLTAERTALNFLGHLSGIATQTRKFVEAASAGGAAVLDTRKTTPGLRELEKAAVRAGGGLNHRMSLSDMVLIKDNHLAAMGIAEAVAEARAKWPQLKVEVECDTLEQALEAADAGADVVMLDNMAPGEVARCVGKLAGRCPIEVSGNVSLETIGEYSAAGADLISVGRLTHSAPSLDLSMEIRVAPDTEGFF